jgi:hypothetical protein
MNDPHQIIGYDVPAADGGDYGHRVTGYDPARGRAYIVTPIRWSTGISNGESTDIDEFKITYRYDLSRKRLSVSATGREE